MKRHFEMAPPETDERDTYTGTIKRRVMKKSSDAQQPRNKILGRANKTYLIPYMEKLQNEGMTFDEIAERLALEGWRTKSGKKPYPSGLSRLMTENEKRHNEPHKRGVLRPTVPKVSADAPDWIRLVEVVLYSNLPDDAKLKTIEATAKAESAKRNLKKR